MALQRIDGVGQLIWYGGVISSPPAYLNSTAIAATGDKFTMSGRVWTPTRGAKNITRVGFRFGGTVTKAGGSGLTVSLQTTSTTSGPPIQPNEVQSQTVAIANGDAGFAASTWYRTGALSATRTVNYGDLLSVVIEYDGSGRLGADTINFGTITGVSSQNLMQCAVVNKSSGTYTVANAVPVCMLEFDDGTFGNLMGAVPASAINTHLFASGSSPNEYALAFQVPFSCKVDGCYIPVLPAGATSDFTVNLYDGTSVMTGGAISVDGNAVTATAVARPGFLTFTQEIQLTANHQYYLAVTPGSNNVSVYSFDMAASGHLNSHPGGINFNFSTRSGGAWAANTTTRRLIAGLSISGLDDGAGGGILRAPGMTGGMTG